MQTISKNVIFFTSKKPQQRQTAAPYNQSPFPDENLAKPLQWRGSVFFLSIMKCPTPASKPQGLRLYSKLSVSMIHTQFFQL